MQQNMLCKQQLYPDPLRSFTRSPSRTFRLYPKDACEIMAHEPFCVIPSLMAWVNSSNRPRPSEELS